MGFEPEARLNGDEARAKREKIRSIGHGSVIDDYIFEWGLNSPATILCILNRCHSRNPRCRKASGIFYFFS